MASKAQLLGIINTQLASNQPILASQHRTQIITMLDELYNAQSRGNVLAGLPLTSLQLANDTFLAFRNGAALQVPFSAIFADPLTLGTANGLDLDGQELSLGLASADTTGALSAADFNIFSGKQDAGNFVTIDTDQTITAAKVFSQDLFVNGLRVGIGLNATSTIVGQNAGNSSTGNFNSFFGRSAGQFNTTGNSNSFFGRNAGLFNTTGGNNSYFGNFAGVSNTTGQSNSYFGAEAGRFLADNTALTVANNSIFIGFNTKAALDSQTNQIVIGNGAIGAGSNSVVLGHTTIQTTLLRGNVGINHTAPSERLDVNGKARIQDIPNGIGDFITRSATGVLQHRTAVEVLGDIGGNFVTIDTDQTITAAKVFSQDLFVNGLRVGRGLNANSTIVGVNAGNSSTGGNNSFFGLSSGQNNTTGSNNSFFGNGAGQNNTTGNFNNFFGNTAGQFNTTGSSNNFFGFRAGRNNTEGGSNSFFGRDSGFNNTTGSSNSFFGNFAGVSNTTGQSNSYFGLNSGQLNTTGSSNSSYGLGSGQNNTTGGSNSFFGNNSGRLLADNTELTIANNSIFIGRNTKAAANNQSNQIVIGNDAVGAGNNSVVLGHTTVQTTLLRGNVGINHTAPSERLDVNGKVRIQDIPNGIGDFITRSATGVLQHRTAVEVLGDIGGNFVTIDTDQTITAAKIFSLDSSFNGVHVGRGGGNLQNNTRVGLSALENNTTGSENTAIGLQALENNSTGSFNTANGFQALRQNSTGGDNTANGFSALENNSTGSFNTAFGFSTLENNTTGSSNTAIGVESGRFLANNTALTVANNSIFIGRNTKAAANNQSNQIVIGNDAVGAGDNSVVLGHTTITKTVLRGNVGIGTTAPSALLHLEKDNPIIQLRSLSASNPSGISFNHSVSGNHFDWYAGTLDGNAQAFTIGSFVSNGFNVNTSLAANSRIAILHNGNVGIGTTTPAASAILDLSSTTGALLLPRMTTTQRDALTAVNGMLIYNTTTDKTEARQADAWIDLSFFIA